MESHRIKSIDSLRGFAALTVVIHHCLLVFPIFLAANFLMPVNSGPFVYILTHTILHTLWDGHEAVILFFVLSGFVLALPYTQGRSVSYRTFILRRIWRIYVPYLIAVFLSIGLMVLVNPHQIIGSSSWFQSMWVTKPNFKTMIDLVFMSGSSNQNIDTSTWSLVHEMRISILFPFLALTILRLPWFIQISIWAVIFKLIFDSLTVENSTL